MGADYEMTNELRGFVAKEKNIVNYPKAKPIVRKEQTLEGTFDVILEKNAFVEVVMIDANNIPVKVFTKANKEAGILRINYEVKNTDYKAGTYYIIVKAANKEMKREKLVLD